MDRQEISQKIKEILCNNLGIDEEVLTDDIPLFGDGIGLDSIDSLEIIAGIDEEFNVQMTGVEKENFYNVNTLTNYVLDHMEHN
ncbi:MAG: acyl carrier protein [Clostridia bacterium]|nr:acyl carrier protein [Clostridia bacterium]